MAGGILGIHPILTIFKDYYEKGASPLSLLLFQAWNLAYSILIFTGSISLTKNKQLPRHEILAKG